MKPDSMKGYTRERYISVIFKNFYSFYFLHFIQNEGARNVSLDFFQNLMNLWEMRLHYTQTQYDDDDDDDNEGDMV